MTSVLRLARAILVLSSVTITACSLVVAPDERRLGPPDDVRFTGEGGSVDATTSDTASDTVNARDVPIVPPRDVAVTCGAGTTNCNGTCVDLATNGLNCGRCGQSCNGNETCAASRCVPTNTCAAPRMLCSGGCVDTSADANHCGSCTHVCSGGEACVGGSCVARCSAPLTTCAGAGCVDTQTDARNCGVCGLRCPSACTAGVCACPLGQTRCGANCVDANTDASNCGTCGTVCAAGQACVRGACATDACAPATSCRECTGASACGWCRTIGGGSCHTGTNSGPSDGACLGIAWSWVSAQCR